MTLDWTAIIIAIVAAIGGGGVGAAVIKWLSNREVTKADAYQMLSNVYERRLSALTDRATQLESRVASLEGIIQGLKLEVDERDNMIDTLQKENADLRAENECKDRKIAKLESQVAELQSKVADLTARIDAMNNRTYDG